MLVFVTDYNVNINRQTQKSNITQNKFTVAPPIEVRDAFKTSEKRLKVAI